MFLRERLTLGSQNNAHVKISCTSLRQRAKKVVSDSRRAGVVDFAIGLVNSVLNLPDGQVKYFKEFNLQKNCEIDSAHQKNLGGLVEMTFGLVNASFSLPEWQAVKMTFFAPCYRVKEIHHPEHNSRNSFRGLTCSKLKCYTTLFRRETLVPPKEVSHQKLCQASPLMSYICPGLSRLH